MEQLRLPSFPVRLKERNGRTFIFDALRGKYVSLTPEEWVRQHFVNFLINHKGYPAGLLSNEAALIAGGKPLRADTVLFDKRGNARMIIEYKAPSVDVTERVLRQISAYNTLLHAGYLVVSNGISHLCCRMDYASNDLLFLGDIPSFEDL